MGNITFVFGAFVRNKEFKKIEEAYLEVAWSLKYQILLKYGIIEGVKDLET